LSRVCWLRDGFKYRMVLSMSELLRVGVFTLRIRLLFAYRHMMRRQKRIVGRRSAVRLAEPVGRAATA